MYIYFDSNGTIKEVVNDVAIRKGSADYNKLYVYIEGNPEIDDIWYFQKFPNGSTSNEVSFVDDVVIKSIPYDAKRDMTYFKDFVQYKFYVFTLTSEYLNISGLAIGTIRIAVDNSIFALGELTFNIQANEVNADNNITQSQYDYLLLSYANRTLNEQTGSDLDTLLDEKIEAKATDIIEPIFEDYKSTIDEEVEAQNETIASLIQASPSVFDTASNITALTENKGVAVATDTGYIYYWDSTLATPAYVSSGVQYNSLANYTKHSGNQLQDANGTNIYPNIAGVHYYLYKGKAYRGLFATDHTTYLDLNEFSNELYKHTYTQILFIKNDLKLKVLNSATHQIRKITFNNPIAENVTFSSWGSEQSLSKGDYCVIMISLKNSTTEDVTVDEMINNILFSNNDYDVLDTIVSNRNWNSQTHYLEIINDKEITYNFGNLANLGYKINVWKLNAWDITTGTNKELEIGWQPNVFEFTFPKGIYKIFFRKYNSSNTLIDFNYNEIMTNITVVEKPKEKHIHISIDDCVFWSDLIANQNTYTSIFDNSLLNLYKQLHDTYGMVITLNLFNVNGSYDISNVPTKFANEFSSNSMWLKLSFHAEDNTTYYNVDKVDEITASYNKFVSAVYQMTKDFNCIDGVVRLGFFSGTLNNIKAIRDCKCGIKGLFTADDTRVSYYLDTTTNNFILNHSKYFDSSNQLELIKTQTRLESETIEYSNLNSKYSQNVNYANFSHYYEFFTHEYEINSEMILKMKNLCLWAILNNYKFVFYQDLLKL